MRIIGYNNLPTTPPLAPITAKLPPEARRSRFAVRRLLAALGYQETINFSFVEDSWERDLAGNADPITPAEPDRQPDERDALVAARLAAAGAQVQPRPQGRAGARVRAGPRVPARRVGRHDRQHRQRHPPADAGGGPGLRRRRWPAVGAQGAAGAISTTSRATSKPCCRRCMATVRAGGASRHCIRAAAPRVLLDGQRGRRRRRTASALAPEMGASRMRRCCSNSTSMPSSQRRVPVVRAGAQVPGRERDIAVIVADSGHARRAAGGRACGRHRTACCATLCCSTSTSPKQAARRRWRCQRKKPGRALDAGQRRQPH